MSNIEIVTAPISATYKTDCFRAVKDGDGDVVVKRWVEDRPVVATLAIDREAGAVFHRGARIA